MSLVSTSIVVATCAALPQTTTSATRTAVIDINRATVEEFARLPGVGPRLAQQIVTYRAKQGPYHRIEDLMIVKGIGPKKWKALRPFICVRCGPGSGAVNGGGH